MDKLEKIIVVLGIILIIVIAIGYFVQTKNESSTNSNSIIMKAQQNFTNKEINAIENSHLPITINPSNAVFFGNFESTSQRLCGQLQGNFGLTGTSLLNVLYNNYYVPIYVNVQALGSYAPNLIGQKVYLNFVINNNESISTYAPYIVKSEFTKNNEEYWNFTFDGNTSNAINSFFNNSTANMTGTYLNGIVLSNHTPIISPKNPDIDNGKFIVPNC